MTAKRDKTPLEIRRFIKAPRDRVYSAWTDPEQLKKWFGPENVQTRDLVADVRLAGQFRWDCTDPEGKEVTISGEYRELEPGKKIVFTWRLEEDVTNRKKPLGSAPPRRGRKVFVPQST
jgi:uncharacterized protein YndB with AHSA1/START domain